MQLGNPTHQPDDTRATNDEANAFSLTDELDADIVQRLRQTPRVPSTNLAREFSVVSATIGARIHRMHEEGTAQVQAVTPLDSSGSRVLVLAFVKADSLYAPSLDTIASTIARISEVLAITSLLSEYQLFLWISATDLAHAELVLEKKLGQIRGIVSVRSELVTQVTGERNDAFVRLGGDRKRHFLAPLSDMLSDAEQGVLAELRDNGRQSVREIARRVGKTERTVRSAIRSMEQKNLLDFRTFVFPAAFGLTQTALIEIDIDHHRHGSIVNALSEAPEVSYVLTTTGRSHRIKIIAHVRSDRALASLLNATIAPLSGVLSMRTTPIINGFKHETSYVLMSSRAAVGF